VEIDYPHGTTYLEQVHQPDADNMNSAGLVLDSDAANQLVVVSVSATADEITRRNVLPGDIILQIEGKSETPWTITEASQALSGAVGETRRLLIRRRGMEIDTSVIIARLL
jgi:C-terminal processing protease CtpA/Prc